MGYTFVIFVYTKIVRYDSSTLKDDILVDVISFNMWYYLTIDLSN